MEPPSDTLLKLVDTISGVCGPRTVNFIPVFKQNVNPHKISSMETYVFEALCNFLKEDSNFFLEVYNYKRASQCLNCALRVHQLFENLTFAEIFSRKDLFHIHLVIASCAMEMKDFTAVLSNSNACIELDPTSDKPYEIAAQAKSFQGDFVAASLYIFRILSNAIVDKHALIRHLTCLSMFLGNISESGDFKKFKPFTKSVPFNDLTLQDWHFILQVLRDQKKFAAMAVLTTGNCGVTFEPATYIHKLADIPGFKYRWLDVGQMLKYLRENNGIKAWHLKLVDFMVKREADVLKISQAFSQPLLVIMTALSVEGEVPSFLDLAWDHVSCVDYDATDRHNNTPLHAFVRAQNCKTSKMAEVILKSLLAKGCVAHKKDLRGKMPHEYVPRSHKFHQLLLNATKSPDEGIVHRLEEIRKRSNEALSSDDLSVALDGYMMAIKIAEKFPHNLKEEKAILYSNMAAVHLKKKEPKEALEAAQKSLRNDAGFVKSYLRQGQAYSKLKKYTEACRSFMCGFDATSNQQEEVKFCMEAVCQISYLTGEHARQILVEMKSNLISVWPELLGRLTREGNWTEVNILLCGPPKFNDDLGLMAGYLCKTAELKTIFDLLPRVKFDVGHLVLILLERKADFNSLAVSEEDTPLHALTRLFVRKVVPWDVFGLAVDILQTEHLSKLENFCLDAEKRSLLHTVCLESLNLQDSEHIGMSFTLLLSLGKKLNWNLNPNFRDKHGKRPVDYCKPGSQMHGFVKLVTVEYGSKRSPSPSSYYKSKQNTQADSASKERASKRFSSPCTTTHSTSSNLKWQDLKTEGGKAYKSHNYDQALKLYMQAISTLERDLMDDGKDLKNLPDSNSHDLAVLYGNCAECHFHMGNNQAFFENAKQNVNYDGLWFKGHYRVGRACILLNMPKLAVQAFINSNNQLKPFEAPPDFQIALLCDLVEAAFQLKSLKKQAGDEEVAALLKTLNPISSDMKVSLALMYIKEGTFEFWKKAEFGFGIACSSEPVKTTETSLSIFCKKELLCRQGWICSLILQITNLRDLIPTLKFHPRDNYLHAAITLIVTTGSSPVKHPDAVVLLKTVIEFAKSRNEVNQQDVDGNTALHWIALCKGPCEPMRGEVTRLLIESGINVLMARKDGRIAVEVMSVSDSIRDPVQSATDLAITIERHKTPAKTPKVKPTQSAKEYSQSVPQSTPLKENNKANTTGNSRASTSKDVGVARKKECDECERLLENADRCTNYRNQILIYKDLVQIVKANHKQDDRHKMFRKASMKLLSKLLLLKDAPDIPDCVTELKAVDFQEVVLIAAEAKRWAHLKDLVYKFKDRKGRDALPRFAQKLSLDELIEDREITEASKDELVKLLVSHGAEKGTTLQKAVQTGDWKVAMTLLDLGADPSNLSLSEGDTPLHVAVRIAVEKDPGNLEFLKKLKQLMDKNCSYPNLNLSCQDENGNSLMHLAAKCKFSPHALEVVEKLCAWKCPVELIDKIGQTPLDYLKHNDRRAQFLLSSTTGAKRKTTVFSEKIDTDSSVTKLREKAHDMLSKLPVVSAKYLDEEPEDMDEEDEEEEDGEEVEKDEDDEEEDAEDDDDQVYDVSEDEVDEEDSKQESDPTDNLDIDAKTFDDLLWDVECTEAVWNLLKGSPNISEKGGKMTKKNRIPDEMKRIVVHKIKQLASGDWRPRLQRRIHGVPDSLALHSVQLPGGACILWELAVAFSPHKSQGSGTITAGGDNAQTLMGGGRIYSEIIRVWSVVLHHSELQRKVKWIVGSHKRGKECLVQKKLKGLPNSLFAEVSNSTRNPVLYMEHEIAEVKSRKEKAHQQHNLCPPASALKNEFQILKFYSFTSTLVAAILSNNTRKIDLPFRVTDLEYEMIHLESASPILLLGRSGTGKTTCCLYRLWAKFLCYWEKAYEIGEPWLPHRNPILDIQDHDDEDEEKVPQTAKAREKSTSLHEQREALHSSSESVACETESEEDEQENTDDDNKRNENSEEEGNEQESSGPRQEIFSHLHQLFVTKNPKLCSEVEKNFLKLCNASSALKKLNHAEKELLPNTLQEVEDMSFPLFLTSRQLLLLLDASVKGNPFFARDEELGLKYTIPGWGTQEDIFTIDPLDPNDWLDSDNDDDDHEKGAAGGKRALINVAKEESQHQFGEKRQRKTYLRRECTFEVFANEVWPKISKKANVDCHPSLVWTEIVSFIEGSFEALGCDGGYLSFEDYRTLGRKRAPNFSGDRCKVYAAFELYRKIKQDCHLFDESDLVFNIYKRLKEMNYYQPWILHEIYVDETQDFTQAELALLMCVCNNPNKMFLAGDTAQAIMRGISFRFQDLSSLFYYALKSSGSHSTQNKSIIKVPEKVHQLRYNYRSHSGILSLASSVLDVLQRFFPESFDRLERDQGMFSGPKPVVIETCSSEDLALLLSGNQRVSSHIEFGAHQAILVTCEESKAQLPEVLTAGLVLTIYEAKGLEFDDVLLYNFFADSQAEKEWRVVTEFLNDLATENAVSGGENLVEIDSGVLELRNRPRPLNFDPDHHKILNSELKHLYTAITRARVNVWIFDKDPLIRGPMFEYFKALKLVQCMGAKEEPLSENFIFAQKSTAQQWRKSGDVFMSQKQFSLAAKCFKHAGHQDREKLALAYQSATEASGLRSKPKEMRRCYLKAGAQFVWCGDLHRAALCFQNAGENKLSALAYEKHGEFEAASKQYQSVTCATEASQCLEQVGMYRKAISVLEESHLYDRAIDCLHRYKIITERVRAERYNIPKVLVDNKPKDDQSEDNLCHRAASFHHQNKDFDRAEAAIIRLKNPSDQIAFLEKNGYWKRAAEVLREEGDTEKATTFMLKAGKMDRALSFAKEGFHKTQEASIYLAMARKNQASDQTKSEKYANIALAKYIELKDAEGQAQAKLCLGQVTGNLRLLKEAQDLFMSRPRNYFGEIECYYARYLKEDKPVDIYELLTPAFKAVQHIVTRKLEGTPASFYGLELQESMAGKKIVSWYPAAFPRCREIMEQIPHKQKELQEPGQGFMVDINTAIDALSHHILNFVDKQVQQSHDHLREKFAKLGAQSRMASSMEKYLKLLLQDARLDERLECEWEQLEALDASLKFKSSSEGREGRWQSAKRLMDFLVPDSFPAWRCNGDETRKLAKIVQGNKPAVKQILRFLDYNWDNPGRVGRGLSQNRLKERCKSTAWILEAGLFSSFLLTWEELNVDDKIRELESKLIDGLEHYSEWAKKTSKYALFEPTWAENKKKYIIEHLGSRFLECLESLICKQEAVDALFAFTKMLTILGKRAKPNLMPDTKYLVFWLEVFLSIAWLLIGRGMPKEERKHFYMSTSLFSAVEVINVCILGYDKDFWTVQQLATDPKMKNNIAERINIREDYLIHILVGDSQHSNYSLLAQVPDLCKGDDEGIVNPLAERIVLLSLLVLLNIPINFVHSRNEILIRREFAKLHKVQGLPEDLRLLVQQVHEARAYDNVATAISNYLSRRKKKSPEQLYLCSCEWVGRLGCPVTWTELQPGQYQWDQAFVSDEASSSAGQETRISEHDEDLEKMEEQKKIEAKLEKMQTEAQHTSKRDGNGEEDEVSIEVTRLLQPFSQITSTECEICDQIFDVRAEQEAENTMEVKETPVDEAIIDIDNIPLKITKDLDLQKKHIESPGHIEKMQQFKNFKTCYTKEIHPHLERIKAFTSNASSVLGFIDLETNRMITAINEQVKGFESLRSDYLFRKKWNSIEQLKQGLANIEHEYGKHSAQIQSKIQEHWDKEKKELDHQEKMEDGLAEVDNYDPNDQPVVAKRRGRGRGRGRNGNNDSGRPGGGKKYKRNLPPQLQKLQEN